MPPRADDPRHLPARRRYVTGSRPARVFQSHAPDATAWAAITILTLLGVVHLWRAHTLAWTCDDAFISFRYARHLCEGHGLVFNVGERVEGFTNLLWTLWLAVGQKLGVDVESWAIWSGLSCHAAAFALLGYASVHHWRSVSGGPYLPVAPLCAVLHADWLVYATSGLETPLFSFLLLALVTQLIAAPDRWALCGALLASLTLTRPDGLVVFPAAFGYMWLRRSPWRKVALLCALVLGPAWVWRVVYYGHWVPNTYVAKSADLAWWGQGWKYLLLYLRMYWVFLIPVVVAVFLRHRVWPDRDARLGTGLVLAIVGTYTLAVMRAGGDFMFARLLIPVTPLCFLLLEASTRALTQRRPTASIVVALAILVGLGLAHRPVSSTRLRHGVSDEHGVYPHPVTSQLVRQAADEIRPYLLGLPVRVAIFGTEARLAYYAELPYAVECATGLTDFEIARRPLTQRGQPGHEKQAPIRYLAEAGRAHFTFNTNPALLDEAKACLPECWAQFGRVRARVLFWDADVLHAVRARGAVITDFPAQLDDYIATMGTRTQAVVQRDLARFDLFYFRHAADPARRDRILAGMQQLRPQ